MIIVLAIAASYIMISTIIIKALKCKTLGAELAYTLYSINISAFYADDHLPTLKARR